ncbi:MAG: hypothetical protein FJW83_01410 [Actinobacteria bacterium]|nr:hypothetical protein [Actinomycetota bacterium]
MYPRALAVVAAAMVFVATLSSVGIASTLLQRNDPRFPSLVASPDPTLVGTVANVDEASGCVHLISLGGGPQRELYCPPEASGFDVTEAERFGKPVGPQLLWAADGRLEVTMLRMDERSGPAFAVSWQRLVDPATGAVEDVPPERRAAYADLGTRPLVNDAGDRLSFRSDEETGKVEVFRTDASGRRTTVLSAQGPGDYLYRIVAAFWAPDGRTVLVDDGRILVVTPEREPTVRFLTTQRRFSGFGEDDPGQARFAVTSVPH